MVASKRCLCQGCPLSVQILWPQSAPLTAKDGGKQEAPVLALTPKTKATRTMSIPIQLDVVVYCRKEATLSSGLTLLRDALGAQLQRLAAALLSAAPTLTLSKGHIAKRMSSAFEAMPYLHTMLYVLPSGCEASEGPASQRVRPRTQCMACRLIRPLLAHMQLAANGRIRMGGGRWRSKHPHPRNHTQPASRLGADGPRWKWNTTQMALSSRVIRILPLHDVDRRGAEEGEVRRLRMGLRVSIAPVHHLVVPSAGLHLLPNPTHYEIQKVLVDHCGQDAKQLLGKKMWLGSQDLGYYLDHMLGVTCVTEIFHSGDDVPGGGRKLLHHFQTQGTPVMIGGGELAFTLLGVERDERTGGIRYLIMDPHYQGADELSSIQPKWVGWKSGDSLTHLNTKLFKADTFYSFCLPQRPRDV